MATFHKNQKSKKINTNKINTNINKIKLIWIDKMINVSKEELINRFSIKHLTTIKEGIEELKSIKFQHCYVILSGSFFQDYVDAMKEEVKNLKCIPNVFVYTSENFKNINIKKETLKYANDGFFNRGGIFSEMAKIISRINELEKENDININNSDIYNDDKNNIFEKDLQRIKDSKEKMFTFQVKSVESLIFPSLYNKFISYE